ALGAVHHGIPDAIDPIRAVVAIAAAWFVYGRGIGVLQYGIAVRWCGVVLLAVAIAAGCAIVHRCYRCLAGGQRQGDQQQPAFHCVVACEVFTGLKASSSRISWYAAIAYSTL